MIFPVAHFRIKVAPFFKNNSEKMLYLLVAAVYIFVGINSVGYHQEDEHYQIVEFANYKMGWTTADRLAWEFHEQIRPGLQPFICYIIFKMCDLVSLKDGYDLVLVLRLFSAALSLFAIKMFTDRYKNEIDEKLRPYFVVTSYLLWFVPFVSVRFSSENWSGIFFAFALTAIHLARNRASAKRYFLIGLLLGTSILFRYQSALLVCGIILWLIFINNLKLKELLMLVLAISAMLLVGFVIDHWLYGNYPVTLFNYFFQNIVNDVASRYGRSPWYEYILYIIKSPGPIGILIFLSLITIMYYYPKNIILWAALPFLLVHSIIPHKELRFLFPLVYVVPFAMTLGCQAICKKMSTPLKSSIIVLVGFFNAAGLLAIATTGASSHTAVSNFIHRNYNSDSVNVILSGGINPFMDWNPPFNTFYSSTGLNVQRVHSIWQPDFPRYQKREFTNIFVMNNNDITGPRTEALLKKYRFKKVYQNIPDYIIPIYNWYNRSLNESVMTVYELK